MKKPFRLAVQKFCGNQGNDQLTVVGTGITVFEALKAADELQKENISIRVVDCYSIHPIDAGTLKKCLQETKQKILVTVEDHFEHGGMGDFAAAAVEGEDRTSNKNGSEENFSVRY